MIGFQNLKLCILCIFLNFQFIISFKPFLSTKLFQNKHTSLFAKANIPNIPISQNTRRKMGPPQRKQISNDSNQIVGRVSVYCVASELDLAALRAHVFRRGFSSPQRQTTIENNNKQINNNNNSIKTNENELNENETTNLSNLMLTRSVASSETDIDDEVLHVSNSPLFMNYNNFAQKLKQQTLNLNPNNHINSNNNNNNNNNKPLSNEDLEQIELEQELQEQEDTKQTILQLMSTQDIFYFDYGCVVFWGLTQTEEKAALTELKQFAINEVSEDELIDSYDIMEYIYDRKSNTQRPIRFDRMKVKTLNLEEKLAFSYGMAQSSKLFVLESHVLKSVEMTRYLPKELSNNGKISNSKKELNKLIGKLFVEQTEVNLFSSILDTPTFLWDNDEHLPAYEYIRSYLEVDDRVTLLNTRLSVIRELLDVLNSQVALNNSERLEWIVIWLISVEIILGIASNPLFAGKRVLSALLVPTAILLFKKFTF